MPVDRPGPRLVTRMTFSLSADDLPLPLAAADNSTTSLPLLLGTGGSLHGRRRSARQHGSDTVRHARSCNAQRTGSCP